MLWTIILYDFALPRHLRKIQVDVGVYRDTWKSLIRCLCKDPEAFLGCHVKCCILVALNSKLYADHEPNDHLAWGRPGAPEWSPSTPKWSPKVQNALQTDHPGYKMTTRGIGTSKVTSFHLSCDRPNVKNYQNNDKNYQTNTNKSKQGQELA